MRAKRTRGLLKERKRLPGALFWGFRFSGNFLGNFAAVALLAGCLSAGSFLEAGYEAGMYEGTGRGYRGSVHVQVQISPAGIEDIVITGHSESIYPGAAAMEELLELVLEYGSLDLDAVAGATFSSRGFLDAVEDALDQSREQARRRTAAQ